MPVTVTPFDHTARLILSGEVTDALNFRVNLYSAFTPAPSATTKAGAETAATQLPTANGYVQNTKAITGASITTVDTDGAMLDADDVEWNATGGPIAAAFAMVFIDDGADNPPLLLIDFDGLQTADDTTPLKIVWSANGVIRITVP